MSARLAGRTPFTLNEIALISEHLGISPATIICEGRRLQHLTTEPTPKRGTK